MSDGPFYVDGKRVDPKDLDWDTWDLGERPVKGVKKKAGGSSGGGGGRRRAVGANSVRPQTGSGQAVRKQIDSIIKRTPQVMVKITGGGKSMARIKDHWDYISRNGEIPLEDEDGDAAKGRDELKELAAEWECGGYPIPADGGRRREAFNIVFSMAAGARPEGVRLAVRDFAAREFAGHQYVMALHTPETDPDKNPSPHPHVHLCVKAAGADGRRLNPRKADIHRWREGFAEALRAHGIEAAATTRAQRLQRDWPEPQFARYKAKRQARGYVNKRGEPERPMEVLGQRGADAARVERAKQKEEALWQGHTELVYKFTTSGLAGDLQRAKALVEYLQEKDRGRAAALIREVDQRRRASERGLGQEAER